MSKKKIGRTPLDFTEAEVLEAIKGSSGILLKVAQKLNTAWDTARKYTQMYPACVAALENELETVLDVAENNLFQAINSKDMDAIKWFLSRKGRHRGYADRQAIDVAANVTIDGVDTLTPVQEAALKAALKL